MSAVHVAMLALGLLGFAALALAMERHARHLLQVVPALRWRRVARAAGWLSLAIALLLGAMTLQSPGVGMAAWAGWLSLAALALVFALPKWPWQPPAKPERAARVKAPSADEQPLRAPRRWIGWTLLTATVATFVIGFARVETKPLERDDAIRGTVGPWAFTLAETDRNAPELVDMGVPRKAFRLRFCAACDLDILRVYLKVNRPRALRASGMAFEGNRWEREVEIQLPATLTATSELWMTVVGKDGAVHHASWPMARVSPAAVAWFAAQGRGE